MKKKEILLSVIFGGLLLKIINNQKVLDDHLYEVSSHGHGGIWKNETLSENTLHAKLYRWYKNRKNRRESK